MKEQDTSQWFDEAQKLHQAKKFAEAETLYRRIVEAAPQHHAAWHHLGLVCLGQNKLVDAAEAFQRVLAFVPNHADALTELGSVLARQDHLPEAITKFRLAIQASPKHGKAHNNLGVALNRQGQRAEAIVAYREAVRVQPDYLESYLNLGAALAEQKQPDEAIAVYENALKIRPGFAEGLYQLGNLLVAQRRPAEGVVCLQQAVRLTPNSAEAHNNLGLALAELGRFDDAIASCDESLKLRPMDAKTHGNRGNALTLSGRLEEAVAEYDMALRIQPDFVSAHWNRALAWLTQGDFEHGLAEYEWRFEREQTKPRGFAQPRWQPGASLAGKTVLLWCEQGYGDVLQCVRYAALLKKKGATVWLETPEKLMPLLSSCAGIDRLVPAGQPLPLGFAYQAPLMSLPYLCGTRLSSIPAEVPYLTADGERAARWQTELSASAAFKIGVAWQGNPQHMHDRHRSFSVQWLRTLATLPGVELYSLQIGAGSEQMETVRFPLIDLRSRLEEERGSFQETAAAMTAMDLIISCDSALAHLAGALGVPVWVALATVSDWRWLRDREDTPWYPTMRLFRQTKQGDWRPVFERMRQDVAEPCKPPRISAKGQHELSSLGQ